LSIGSFLIIEFFQKPPQRIKDNPQDSEQSVQNDNHRRPKELIESVFYSFLGHFVGVFAESMECNPNVRYCFKDIHRKPSAFPIMLSIAELALAMIRRFHFFNPLTSEPLRDKQRHKSQSRTGTSSRSSASRLPP
jgi:hypothetical protein